MFCAKCHSVYSLIIIKISSSRGVKMTNQQYNKDNLKFHLFIVHFVVCSMYIHVCMKSTILIKLNKRVACKFKLQQICSNAVSYNRREGAYHMDYSHQL